MLRLHVAVDETFVVEKGQSLADLACNLQCAAFVHAGAAFQHFCQRHTIYEFFFHHKNTFLAVRSVHLRKAFAVVPFHRPASRHFLSIEPQYKAARVCALDFKHCTFSFQTQLLLQGHAARPEDTFNGLFVKQYSMHCAIFRVFSNPFDIF